MAKSADASQELTVLSLSLRDVGQILQRRWHAVALTVSICAGLSIATFFLIHPRYDAKAEVLIEPPKRRALSQDDRSSDASVLDSSVVDSQIPLVLSSRNLLRVIAQEHLTADKEFADLPQSAAHDLALRPDDANRIDAQLTPVIMRLYEHIDVSRVAKSNVVAIKVTSDDPQKSARLANRIAEDYVADQVESRVKVIQQAAALFKDRLDALRQQVRASESALSDYRQQNGMVTTSDEKITISDQQLGSLNERLAFAASETALKLARYEQVTQFKTNAGDLSTIPEIALSPVITQLESKLSEIQRQEADMSAFYGNAYPDVIRLKAQKQAVQRALTNEVGRLDIVLKNDFLVAKAREAALQKQIASLVTPAGVASDAGVELRELQRSNLANKALFENFLAKAKITQEESTFETPDSRLISPALIPMKPSFPKLSVILFVGTAIGTVLGLMIALLLDLRRTTMHRPVRYRGLVDQAAE